MKKKYNILIDRLKQNEILLEKRVLGESFKIVAVNLKDLQLANKKLLSNIDGVLAWHEAKYDRKSILLLPKCKIIVRVGVGYDNVDLDFATSKRIIVCNVPDYGINDVADHAISLLLFLIKKIGNYSESFKNNNIWKWGDLNKIKRIHGFKLGILGFGRIGSSTAVRAKSFGMKVSFFDPYLPRGIEKSFNVERFSDLNKFLSSIDALSIHTPLTNETKNLVDSKFLKKIKKGSIIINTARGGIVNTLDIYTFLKNNHLDSFGTDVFDEEPPRQENKLIYAWKNNEKWINNRFIITPHCAPFNRESYKELREKAAIEIKNYFINKISSNKVN